MAKPWSVRLLLAGAVFTVVGCGSEGPSCGPGTVVANGACVPAADALGCGPGVSLVDGACTVVGDSQGGAATDSAGDNQPAVDTQPATDAAVDASPTADLPTCAASCAGRQCGDDGCGGSCGSCLTAAAPVCNAMGQCVAKCVPQCTGKDCGDDGCGATCGACAGGLSCSAIGRCIPPGWTCAPAAYNGGFDACHCGCGAPDPDCKNPDNLVAGCTALQTCDASGACVDKVPKAWICAPSIYGALDSCDCGCGAKDPDCDLGLPLFGCKQGETCSAAGVCEVCKPSCAGKQCGPDGCGGTCGTCKDPSKATCADGLCVDACSPKPVKCKTNACGDDGCGGICGTCPNGQACGNGQCSAVALPTAPTSCADSCGSVAPAGCYCVPSCQAEGSCCADFKAVCGCKPVCGAKKCGDDGCGGACGTCGGPTPFCGADGQCTAACDKKCTGKTCGPDGCGGSCGACPAGTACSYNGQCIPAAWHCPKGYFGDGIACDCSCGTADPDCADAKLPVYGCPSGSDGCDPGGICKVSFCNKPTDCGAKWCKGSYPAGGGWWKGACGTPDALGVAPGQPCTANAQCASAACLQGSCATYCQSDADCLKVQRCLGALIANPVSGQAIGIAGICQTVSGSAVTCGSQAACPKGEVCLGYADAVTGKAKYLCATGSLGISASCLPGFACADGKMCAAVGAGGVCTVACPGGQTDCPAGSTCKPVLLYGSEFGLGQEPKVSACLPN